MQLFSCGVSGAKARSESAADVSARATTTMAPDVSEVNKIVTDTNEAAETAPDNFTDLGLSKWLVDALRSLKIEKPTPVQKVVIPPMLAGRDVVASAETGSGKTLAFAAPILNILAKEMTCLSCVCLSPTRELAIQISEHMTSFGRPLRIKVVDITGGTNYTGQSLSLSYKPHVVVGSPGRLSAILDADPTFSLKTTRFLVLDEADRLIGQPKYVADMDIIMGRITNKRKQVALMSATMSNIAGSKIMLPVINPVWCFLSEKNQPVKNCIQKFVIVPEVAKEGYLITILNKLHLQTVLFADTREEVELLNSILSKVQIPCTVLHSTMNQQERNMSLWLFSRSKAKVLIATDVASRGLDLPLCQLVINFHIPEPDCYVHRVGRTARAGTSGLAITLVHLNEAAKLHLLEKSIGKKLIKEQVLVDDGLADRVIQIVEQSKLELATSEFAITEAKRFIEKKLKKTPLPLPEFTRSELVRVRSSLLVTPSDPVAQYAIV
ncbi:ATP-dependent RNA helicase DBP8 [Pelomyxa schiedti]|nr:ATP-dependent RNA helicase DBP8 [Pelomyxa schiedti]